MFTKQQLIRVFIKSGLKAGIAILGALIIIFLLSQNITHSTQSLVAKKKLANFLEHRSEGIRSLREEFITIGDQETALDTTLLPEDNILDFVSAIETMAKNLSTAQSYKFSTPVFSGSQDVVPISTIDYSLIVGGNIETFTKYLKRFEALPYLSKISSISMNAPPTGWSGNATFSMHATLYTKHITGTE